MSKCMMRCVGMFVVLCVACFMAGSAYAEKAAIEFHLDFDEVSDGKLMVDKVGGLKAVLRNTSQTEGRFGKALYFNGKKGSKGAYVVIPESKNISFLRNFDNGPFTLEVWFKPDEGPFVNHQTVLGNSIERDPGYQLSYNSQWDMCPFVVGLGGGKKGWYVGPQPKSKCIVAGIWNHVAIVKDDKGLVTYYGNGLKHSYYGPGKVDKSKEPVEFLPGGEIIIGAMKRGCPYAPFKGAIDELRIYRGARTAAEIYTASQGLEGDVALNLDGKFDEAIWKEAKQFTGFRLLRKGGATTGKGGAPAEVQTEVLVAHDARYLYFGVTVYEPRMDKLKDIWRKNSAGVYRDDSLEIMLDADGSSADYYHLLLNPSGYKAQMMHVQGGPISLPWKSNWFVGTAKAKDRWTAEVAIPFAILNREDSLANRMRFNVARNRRVDLPKAAESSLLPGGEFHEPTLFLTYDAEGVDTAQYLLRAGQPVIEGTAMKKGKLHAAIALEMRNAAKQTADADLRVTLISPNGEIFTQEAALSPAAGKAQPLSLPFKLAQPGTYTLSLTAKRGNSIVFDSIGDMVIDFVPLAIDVTRPFYRNSIYFTENLKEIRATVIIGLLKEDIAGKTLKVALKDLNGKVVAEDAYKNLARRQKTALAVPALTPGKYQFVAMLTEKGKVVENTSEIIRKLPKAPALEVRVDENLRLVINGKPTLPVVWWGDRFEEIAKSGSDGALTGFWGKGGSHALANLDKLHALGLMGGITLTDSADMKFFHGETLTVAARQRFTEKVNAVKDHPALLYYYLGEEPEGHNIRPEVLRELYDLVRELDPYHPTATCNNSLAGQYTYADSLDIFLPDPYIEPVKDGGLLRPMTNTMHAMNTSRKAGKGKKLIGVTPQVFEWASRPNRRAPNFTEERCHQFLSIVHGARMINNFKYGGFDNSPDLIIGMPPIIKEIKSLTPIILHGKAAQRVAASDPAVHLMAHNHNGKLFIIACNVEPKQVSATVTVPRGMKKFRVVSENRQVTVNNGRFPDKFIPYGVHIYTSDQNFRSHVSLAEIKQAVKAAGGSYSFTYDKLAGNNNE